MFGSGISGGAVIIDVRVLLDRLLWSGHSASDLLSSWSLFGEPGVLGVSGVFGSGRGPLLVDFNALADLDARGDFGLLFDLDMLADLETSGIILYDGRGFLLVTSPATGTGATFGSETACVKAKPKLMSPSAASLPDGTSFSLVLGLGFLFCAGEDGRARLGCGGLNLKSKPGELACCTLFMRLRRACEVLVPQEPLGWRSGICVGVAMLSRWI